MTEPPEHPAHDSLADKPVVGGAQAALDATNNALRSGEIDAGGVEERLRTELEQAGVGDVSEDWVRESAETIAAGEPVVISPDETTPDS